MFLSNFQCVLNHSGMTYWAIHSFTRSFTRTAHSFTFSALLCSRAPMRSFICPLARPFTCSRAHGKEVFAYELNASISCSFNPLWAARQCVYVCMCVSVCVCQCAYVHACVHVGVSAPLCIHRTGRK